MVGMVERLRVGLVGAGPWAEMVHARGLAGAGGTVLAGIWARRPEAARRLAAPLAVPVFEDLDALFAACDAVAFSVPPDVQATLATRAARAGKALLLEKPIAADLAGAEALTEAIDRAGVPSMVVLTWRYAPAVREFLDAARSFEAVGGRGWFISGAFLGSPFATPWRLDRGPLLDLGPHVIDLLEAALGPVTHLQAHGDLRGWVGLQLTHEGGAHSDASLCATARVSPHLSGVELFGPEGALRIDCTATGRSAFETLYDEFVATVHRGLRNGLDVHRGLHLQRLIEQAEDALRAAGRGARDPVSDAAAREA